MSLRDRLRKQEARAAARRAAARAAGTPASGRPDDGAAAAGARPAARAVEERSADGVTVRTTRFSLDARHGRHALGEVAGCDAARLGTAARLDAPLPAGEATYLDTETTDLGGGAGVYVFQVGMLTVGRDEVTVEQVLLEGPEHEPAFLERVLGRVLDRPRLVTFCGKSFDRHRLDDRAAMLGLGRPLGALPHLDLVHVGRRLFGRTLRRTRLRDFEQELLGVRRVDDLGGAECPDAWFDWLAGDDDGRLERVFEHNLIDVLSLLALTIRVDRALGAPADAGEAAAAGLVLRDGGAVDAARPLLERAAGELAPGTYRVPAEFRKAALALAKDLARGGAPADALAVLDRLAAAAPGDPAPVLEAAKLCEHALKDRAGALDRARELRARWMMRDGGARRMKGLEDAARRIARLSS
ncbi:MAG: ribonuclease H-like domain-containing protein [Planctomycetota bacterium JB042]